MTKVCTKCGVEKDVEEFYRNKARKSGVGVYCRCCVKIIRSTDAVKESRKEYAKKYYTKNKEKIIASTRKYYEENKEHLYQKKKERWGGSEEYKKKRKISYHKNKNKLLRRQKKWYDENREEIIARRKEKRDLNPSTKANERFSSHKAYLSKKLDIKRSEIPEILIEAKIHVLDARKKIKSASD